MKRLLWNRHKSIICFSRILKKNFMNNAAEMMENIHMIYSQVTKGQNSTIIVQPIFGRVWRSKGALHQICSSKKSKVWKDLKLSKTRRSANVLQTDKVVINFSIGYVGSVDYINWMKINQSRHICLKTYKLLKWLRSSRPFSPLDPCPLCILMLENKLTKLGRFNS